MAGGWYASNPPPPPNEPRVKAYEGLKVPADWNASMEKEFQETESKFARMQLERAQAMSRAAEALGDILGAGPLGIVQAATRVREILKPFDASAGVR
jgi:hypothetical protein